MNEIVLQRLVSGQLTVPLTINWPCTTALFQSLKKILKDVFTHSHTCTSKRGLATSNEFFQIATHLALICAKTFYM
jgi:hypothetical protein